MIRILIIDDHTVVREGMKLIFKDDPELSIEGEASTGVEGIEKAREGNWDLVVLDINLPDCSGFDVLKAIKVDFPNIKILVLTMHEEAQYAIRVIKAGANGFINKESEPEQIINAIKRVASGGRYINPVLAEELAFELCSNRPNKSLHELLSDREFQVLGMLGAGNSPKEIGEKLCLSVKTINTYRSRILEKMNLKSNADLIHYALANNLVGK